ncbi:hypothetical protein [Rossellomorea aquimaris]|uniref:hypothetical protein n=1 Tax=Rossellomorea aquimaris TaxID=189382 RepID=UPI0011E94DE4|nr:hypothetical protein [Rossellomorea aquimaris]TYS91214.1 hypothetical protein FZC88_03440 [Rossellomorea aquimaris]
MKYLSPIQLQQQIIHYKSELEKYKHKCSTLEKHNLAREYHSIKKENQRLENLNEDFRIQIEKIIVENEQLSIKYQSSFKSQEKEIKKLRYTINQLKDQLRKINLLYSTEVKKLVEHNYLTKTALEKEIISSEVSHCYLIKEKELLTTNKQEMEKQLYSKEMELLEMEELIEELKIGWREEKQNSHRLNSFEKHKNNNLSDENKSLNNELYVKEMELLKLKELIEELKIEGLLQKQHLLKLNSFEVYKNYNLLDENESLKAQLYLREVELYEVQQTLSESTSHYDDLLITKANQLEQASKMQIEKSAYIQKIETSLKKLVAEKEAYTNTLHSLRKNIKRMKEEVFSFKEEESAEMKNKIKSYEDTIQHLQFTNAHLIEEINKLKNRAPK